MNGNYNEHRQPKGERCDPAAGDSSGKQKHFPVFNEKKRQVNWYFEWSSAGEAGRVFCHLAF
jgi:hypothetical protein